ncbi:polyprenyl synthetase family protein [Desulfosarcina sp. OttesenSCG-928-A07]|nr:polyprenyl synthetase family protein [Desulfosarcina sp. OttesenSCG-928-G17]MDL2330197.1 polyprenyl synthetase family protein [Desulfosarcina sp. OttesenSCG-928-A07]
MTDPKKTDLKTKILSAVQGDLAAIETALTRHLAPHFELVSQVAGHILFAGGKRFRPLLTCLAARLCGLDDPKTAEFSIIFEYLHAASLLHDDVIDEADMRRGRPVAGKVWNNAIAVLTGDFLMSRALSIAMDTGIHRILKIIADVTNNMSQGEIQQLARKGDVTLTQAEYLEVIHYKTAVLFEGACHAGGLLAGADSSRCEALSTYGYHLGIAFQMADDLLDYTQDLATLGKRAGADLREGKMTLPLIHALSRASEKDRDQMVSLVGKPDFSDGEFSELVEKLYHYEGIAYTQAQTTRHADAAKTALSGFKDGPDRELLMLLVDYAHHRQS